MEQNELLEIKKQVLDNEKKNILSTYDGKLHTHDLDILFSQYSINDILKILYRDKENILKISEKNLRWVNDYALITLIEAMDSKLLHAKNLIIENENLYDGECGKNSKLTRKIEEDEKIIDELKNKICEYEKEKIIYENNTKEEETKQHIIDELNKHVTELESILGECHAKLDEAEKNNKETFDEYTKVKNELTQVQQKYSSTIEALNDKISDLNNEIYEYADTISKINNSIKPVSTRVEKHNKRIGTNFESGPNIGV